VGYHTDFVGEFKVIDLKTGEPEPLSVEQVAYLQKFNDTRRMKRDAKITAQRRDPLRDAVNLDVGDEGAYFVSSRGIAGQEQADGIFGDDDEFECDEDGNPIKDVIDFNKPPKGQPGLWCQWRPSDDGKLIAWDGGEKFYHYVEWLEYLLKHFLAPWGYGLKGTVEWQGDDSGDIGRIFVQGQEVSTKHGRVAWD
jgi:hypothetical protein